MAALVISCVAPSDSWVGTFDWAVKVLRNRVDTSALAISSRPSGLYSF